MFNRLTSGGHHALPFKRQPHKMVKHTRTIRRQIADKLLSAFDHFVGLFGA